jgi:hypothetical protein
MPRLSATTQEAKCDREAQRELARITPPNTELLKLAERFSAPQEWHDEEGDTVSKQRQQIEAQIATALAEMP